MWVEWVEPGENDEVVKCRIQERDAIDIQKMNAQSKGKTYPDDQTALDDFIIVHWGKLVE